MHQTNPLEIKIRDFLHLSLEEGVEIPDEILDDFLARTKASIKKQFSKNVRSTEFRLRMSNIGKDLRQLHLEKEYGSSQNAYEPEFKLKMIIGDITENVMVMLMKASGVNIASENTKVSLTLADTTVEGELDIELDEANGMKGIIDVKSASDYSYNNKFRDFNSLLESGDEFGYIGQGFGYAFALTQEKYIKLKEDYSLTNEQAKAKSVTDFLGWFVVNKSTGEFKFVAALKDYKATALARIRATIEHFKFNKPIPPCAGVEDEVWYKKTTGNLVLGSKCTYCKCKEVCHPGIKLVNSPFAKGSGEGKPKWYVKLVNLGKGDKE